MNGDTKKSTGRFARSAPTSGAPEQAAEATSPGVPQDARRQPAKKPFGRRTSPKPPKTPKNPKPPKGKKREKARDETVKRERPRLSTHAPRKGRGLFYGLITGVLSAGMLFFAMTIFFDVRVIDVRGMTHYDESEVVRLLGFKWGENLMFIDTASAEKNVRDQLPYIRDISISRQLPDRAVVEVVEREPRAAVASGSSYSIFDEEGVIFDHIVIGRPDESIVLIKGVTLTDPKVNSRLDGQDDEHLRPALQVLNALYDYDMIKDVKVIDARESFNIRFDYLGRFTVELGLNDNVADKLRTLDKVVSDLEPHQTGIIDLSAKRTRFVDDTQGGKL